MNTPNPLSGYQRHEELSIKLPTGGRWWPDGSIQMPDNGELPVFAMTGHDDLMLKNADGLMNGSTTTSVIQSCVPAIKNAWKAPTPDVEYMFVAIRIASYGHELESEAACEKCGEITKYGVDLRVILDQYKLPNYDKPLDINGLSFFFRPPSYELTNLVAQEIFEQQRALYTARNENLTPEQKKEIVENAVQKLTDISVSKMHEYIDYVLTPDGTKVDSKEFISEFIDNADRKTFDLLRKNIDEISRFKSAPQIPFKCSQCGHEETHDFKFDPSDFFEADS